MALPFCQFSLKALRSKPLAYPKELRKLGDWIRQTRLDRKLTQEQTGQLLGVTESCITNWELHHSEPETRYLPQIIAFIGYCPYDTRGDLIDRVRAVRLTLGLSPKRFQSYVTDSSVKAEFVIACFDAYCAQLTKPCLVVLDNAPMHRSAAFEAKLKAWEEDGMYLLFLPPYCPELNLIEILWRKLKYEWLPLSAYGSFKQLTETLENTLKQIGSKYLLSFA